MERHTRPAQEPIQCGPARLSQPEGLISDLSRQRPMPKRLLVRMFHPCGHWPMSISSRIGRMIQGESRPFLPPGCRTDFFGCRRCEQEKTEETENEAFILCFLLFASSASEEICPAPRR